MGLNRKLRKIRNRLNNEDGAILILICVFTIVAAFAAIGTGVIAQTLIARARLAGATQAVARAMTESRDWYELLVSDIKYKAYNDYRYADSAQFRAWIRSLLQEQGITRENGYTIDNIDFRYASRGMGVSDSYGAVKCMVYDHSLRYERFDKSLSYDSLMGHRHDYPFFTVRVRVTYQTIWGSSTFTVTKSAEIQELLYNPNLG